MIGAVSTTTRARGGRLRSGVAVVVAVAILATGGSVVWYRATYNVWPGQRASARVHYCGRDYETAGGPSRSWQQITAQAPIRVRVVGQYPPLAWSRRELLAAVIPDRQRMSESPPLPCAMVVYLRTGPDQYQTYGLLGGP